MRLANQFPKPASHALTLPHPLANDDKTKNRSNFDHLGPQLNQLRQVKKL